MNYLLKAVENLTIYTTTPKIVDYVNQHKFDFLIQNPKYENNSNT